MRIALITSDLPSGTGGGAERYAADLAGELQARGNDVLVLTASADTVPGVPTRRLPPLPRFDPAGGAVYKAAWHVADQWRPAVHRAALAALDGFRPDVVHTHRAQGLSAAVFTAIAARALPHVHTVHDLNLLCARVTMTRSGLPCHGRCAPCLVQRAVRASAVRRRLDTLVSPSDFLRDKHVAAGVVPAAAALTIPQGAEGEPRRRGQREWLTFGYMGALEPHKGVATLLATGAPLLVAGAGSLAGAARAASDVRFVGPVSGAGKDAFFDQLDVLVVPSEWEENAPLVVVEAAVRGIPCVVSDRGGLPESPHAWVVRAGRASELRAFLEALTPAEVDGRSSALLAERHRYTWSHHVDRVADALGDAARE